MFVGVDMFGYGKVAFEPRENVRNRLFCNLPDRGHLDRTSPKNKTHVSPKRRSDVAIVYLIRRHSSHRGLYMPANLC
jgi:hypothetical protein